MREANCPRRYDCATARLCRRLRPRPGTRVQPVPVRNDVPTASTQASSSSKNPVRLLCVDDHRTVREGVALILSREPDFTVVATAATAREAVVEFKRHL